MDERPNAACCLFADDEEVATDPEAYDCATCSVREAIATLWPENQEAWTLYRRTMTRFAHDMHLSELLLKRLTKDLDDEALTDLMTRLAIIYDELNPMQATAQVES